MKKTILFKDGQKKVMECNEEFLNMFRGLGMNILKRYKSRMNVTEDDLQDIDVTIFEAFLSYDEEHCFTTHLFNQIRGKFSNQINKAKTIKRDTSKLTIINLEYNFNNDGDRITTVADIISDGYNIEDDFIENDFISYLMNNLDEFELDMLAANLKRIQFKEICEKYNLKKTTLSNRNWKFKQKLKDLISEYNK